MCDIADVYLEELVSRCMVLVEQRSDEGKIKSCRMHDLMRDMCIQKATEEGYFSLISTTENLGENPLSSASASVMNTRLHRLAIDNNNAEYPFTALCNGNQNSKHLRSLLLFRDQCSEMLHPFLKFCLENCLLLRVVDLEGAQLEMLPEEIENLIHLKYLGLRNTRVNKLSWSIIKLQCLQTLDLRIISSVKMIIPNLLWKLRKLRYLFLPPRYEAPKALWLHTLGHLETLQNLDLENCRAEDLLDLKSLRRLTLQHDFTFLTKTRMNILKLILCSPNIASGLLAERMHIKICGYLFNEELVDQLLQLQGYKLSVGSLEVDGHIYMGLGAVQNVFWNLTSLTFLTSGFDQIDPMSVLERLPKLSKLKLESKSIVRETMICSTGWFPELIDLKLRQLDTLEEFIVEEGAMPKLQRLEIWDCDKLKKCHIMLPDTVDFIQCCSDLKRSPSMIHH